MHTDEYGILDLLESCNCPSEEPLFFKTHTMKKELNFIEKIKLDKFATSKEAEQLGELMLEAEAEITKIGIVLSKLANLSNVVADSVDMLEEYIDDSEINSILTVRAELTEQLKQIKASNFADPINKLADIFGIESEKNQSVTAEEVSKTLGFKTKTKKA